MHLPDGIIPANICAAGYAGSGIITYFAARYLPHVNLPRLSMVTAALFVASILHVPFMGTSVHFTLVGLAGVLLGPLSFVAVGVATLFQFLFFRHGGITTWGLNALHMGLGALAAWLIYSLGRNITFAFLAGFGAAIVKLSAFSITLLLAGFPLAAVGTLFLVHLPIVFGEGLITSLAIKVLSRWGCIYGQTGNDRFAVINHNFSDFRTQNDN